MSRDITLKVLSEAIGSKYFDFESIDKQYSSGFYKGVMLWIKCLLTQPGTDLSDLTYGSSVANLIGGNIVSINDVRDLVYLGVNETTTKVKQLQAEANAKDSERILSAEIVDFSTNGVDGFQATILLSNALGDKLALRLPIDLGS